jgi:hypothetical protein
LCEFDQPNQTKASNPLLSNSFCLLLLSLSRNTSLSFTTRFIHLLSHIHTHISVQPTLFFIFLLYYMLFSLTCGNRGRPHIHNNPIPDSTSHSQYSTSSLTRKEVLYPPPEFRRDAPLLLTTKTTLHKNIPISHPMYYVFFTCMRGRHLLLSLFLFHEFHSGREGYIVVL